MKHYLESMDLYSRLKDIVGQKNVCEKLITLYLIKDPSKVKEFTELYLRLVKEIREKT